VREAGGLFVIGTERHESRRIDDQLVGRSGRQGDVGETQFLISMEDEIMQLFGSEKVIDVMEEIDIPEDEGIGGASLDRAFAHAQDLVESKNYDGRLYLYKYDRVTNFQRGEVYRLRDSLLENEEGFKKFYGQSVGDVLRACVAAGSPDEVAAELKICFSVDVPLSQLLELAEGSKVSPAAARKTVYARLYDTLLGAAGRIDELPEVYQAACRRVWRRRSFAQQQDLPCSLQQAPAAG
jgi:preprotein translocase subunit SecA